jgi:hypothetical protein
MMKFSKYYIFRNTIKSMQTKQDITNFYNKFIIDVTDKTEIELINSLLESSNFSKIIDYDTFISLLNKLIKIQYRVDANKFVEKIIKNTDDIVQINTIYHVLHMANTTNEIVSLQDIRTELSDDMDFNNKSCPHCNINTNIDILSNYMICGYTEEGFDWNGCGKDWCIKCGKMLCKSWQIDQLYDKNNRVHDKLCCKNHSQVNNNIYPDMYCQCIESYVDRRNSFH